MVQPDDATGLLGIALLEDGVVALAPHLPSPDPTPSPSSGADAALPAHPSRGDVSADGRPGEGILQGGAGEGPAGWDAVLRALSLASSVDHFSPLLNARGCDSRT